VQKARRAFSWQKAFGKAFGGPSLFLSSTEFSFILYSYFSTFASSPLSFISFALASDAAPDALYAR
jgi:hypothetical protein